MVFGRQTVCLVTAPIEAHAQYRRKKRGAAIACLRFRNSICSGRSLWFPRAKMSETDILCGNSIIVILLYLYHGMGFTHFMRFMSWYNKPLLSWEMNPMDWSRELGQMYSNVNDLAAG